MNSLSDFPNVVYINSFEEAGLDFYVRYNETQLLHAFEPDEGVFIAETPLVISRAIEAGYEPLSFLVDESCANKDFINLVQKHGDVKIYAGPNELISEMVGYKLTRGILAAMRRRKMLSPEEICKGVSRIAVLDNVMNPVNVGAIFRSAAALGVEAVLLTEGCSDPLYRRALRVGMGAAVNLPWTYITDKEMKRTCEKGEKCGNEGIKSETEKNSENKSNGCGIGKNLAIMVNSAEYIDRLKSFGFTTVAMALKKDSVSISDPRIKNAEKLAIVLGNEGFGLPEETIRRCDYTAMIPMYKGIDSLNVAAAGAVIFWELCSNRT